MDASHVTSTGPSCISRNGLNSRSGRVQYSLKPAHRILDMVNGKLIAYDDARSIFKTMEQCNHTNRYDDARSIFKTMEQCNANTKIHSHEQ
ncbi:hypothetical protein Tco_1179829, partial [Tanacetum coccineum]